MTPEEVQAHFTQSDGSYRFARWGRPIAPVVFGVEEATLATLKGAIEAVVTLANHKMAETDPELGANFMLFFLRDWNELLDVPDLDRLIGDIPSLVARLGEASQYRTFRFDEAGAIKACFAFTRMDTEMAELPAETIALSLAVQGILMWSDQAFVNTSALAQAPSGEVVLRPEVSGIIQAAYDPVMPAAAGDASHALRLAARVGNSSFQ